MTATDAIPGYRFTSDAIIDAFFVWRLFFTDRERACFIAFLFPFFFQRDFALFLLFALSLVLFSFVSHLDLFFINNVSESSILPGIAICRIAYFVSASRFIFFIRSKCSIIFCSNFPRASERLLCKLRAVAISGSRLASSDFK